MPIALFLAGCAAPRPIEGWVLPGQVATVGGPKVRPGRIIEDSRCRKDVTCIHAGRLIVQMTVLGGGWSVQRDLTLGVPVPVADGLLTLVDATPPGSPPRFSFRFQGGL